MNMAETPDTNIIDAEALAIAEAHLKAMNEPPEEPASVGETGETPKTPETPATENKDERDPGDEDPNQPEETPEEKPEEKAAEPTITPKLARVADRFLSVGFGVPDHKLNQMDDSKLVEEAVVRAKQTLRQSQVPARVVDLMTDEEKIEAAFEHRRTLLSDKRRYEANKNHVGDGRKTTIPEPTPDPLKAVGDVLELLDPGERKRVEDTIKRLQDDRDQAMQKVQETSKRVLADNIAGAFIEVSESFPGFDEDHQAAYEALADVADEIGADLHAVASKGGPGLLRLARLAAEKMGLEQQSTPTAKPAPATNAKPKHPQTPPKPNTRGGRVTTLTQEQKDLAFAQAMLETGGNVEAAKERYRRQVGV